MWSQRRPPEASCILWVPCQDRSLADAPFSTQALEFFSQTAGTKKTTTILFFCEIYCFHIKRFLGREVLFFNLMMILYSCPEQDTIGSQ